MALSVRWRWMRDVVLRGEQWRACAAMQRHAARRLCTAGGDDMMAALEKAERETAGAAARLAAREEARAAADAAEVSSQTAQQQQQYAEEQAGDKREALPQQQPSQDVAAVVAPRAAGSPEQPTYDEALAIAQSVTGIRTLDKSGVAKSRVKPGSRGNHHRQGQSWKQVLGVTAKWKRKKFEFDSKKSYGLLDAIYIMKKSKWSKMNESVRLALKLGIDPRNSSHNVRILARLPHGIGRSIKVAVFCDDGDELLKQSALEAGAHKVGGSSLIQEVKDGNIDFDFALSTPSFFRRLAEVGRILGPRQLMPTVKLGSVTNDIPEAVKEATRGSQQLRNDKKGNLNFVVGKISFDDRALAENIQAAYDALISVKPTALKGKYIMKITVSTDMGPGVLLDMRLLQRSSWDSDVVGRVQPLEKPLERKHPRSKNLRQSGDAEEKAASTAAARSGPAAAWQTA
ncbi:50S ribosomal protein L1 [Porphyridium purpureum]|uniref:Large ribosomal subunit protein uL1c n=1 Tax=Porphyridium purpureum TaxID=35688 RepID=A0A5J4Z3P4_PORPP|nr:50S ribosomal protein L1 [Porphyridium purpureum]|eukprot:POR4738..scf208_2